MQMVDGIIATAFFLENKCNNPNITVCSLHLMDETWFVNNFYKRSCCSYMSY